MPRAVLVQHHPRQRTPLAPAPMRPLARRLGHQPFPLQVKLGPGVAPAKAVILHQMLMEVLDGETLVALAIERLHLLGPVDRNPLARRLAEPLVQKPRLALLIAPVAPAPKRPLAHPKQLRRLLLIQLRQFPAALDVQKHRHAHPLKGFRPAHPNPPKRARPTGQIVRYLNRTYRVLPTKIHQFLA